MRRMTGFTCEGAWCAATLDEGNAAPGLLIVSGGNEIRSGAHAGQAAMAAHFAGLGYPVFRYDRRGIGDSEGENGGFEASAADISAAVAAFRTEAPHVTRIIAFGNQLLQHGIHKGGFTRTTTSCRKTMSIRIDTDQRAGSNTLTDLETSLK